MNWVISIIVKALQKTWVDQKLSTIIDLLEEVKKREVHIMATIQELEAQVAKNVEVSAAAVLLIQGFADRLEAAIIDPAKLEKLRSDLSSASTNLEAAVEANQPVAP